MVICKHCPTRRIWRNVRYQCRPAIFLNQQGYFTQATLSSLNGGINLQWAIGFPLSRKARSSIPLPAMAPLLPGCSPIERVCRWCRTGTSGLSGSSHAGCLWKPTMSVRPRTVLHGSFNYNQLDPRYISLQSLLTANVGSAAAVSAGIGSPYRGFNGSVAKPCVLSRNINRSRCQFAACLRLSSSSSAALVSLSAVAFDTDPLFAGCRIGLFMPSTGA